MHTDVAVVIPAYNSAAYIEQTLRSVLAQTKTPAEIVVVDDGSADSTASIVRAMGVSCVVQANAGPGAARNRGVRLTNAPLVAFLDADDRFAPDKLALQAAQFDVANTVMTCSDAYLLEAGRRGKRKQGQKQIPAILSFADLMRTNPVITSSVMLRRSAFELAGGFDEDRCLISTEDYDLWLRVARLGVIRYLGEPLVEYRVHAASLSSNSRFMPGIDRIMAKVLAAHGSDPSVARAAQLRRAGVRIDAAYDCLVAGNGRGARALLREAGALGARGKVSWKIWLKSWTR